MPEKEKITEKGQISRRQFIKNAGIVVGGTAVGSSFILAACNGDEITKEVTKTVSVTTATPKFVCPYDNQEFDTLAALQSHVGAAHGAGDPIEVKKFVCPYDNQEFDTLAALRTHIENSHITVSPLDSSVVTLNVNGKNYLVTVDAHESLAWTLKERLGLTGTKIGCDMGQCGACTVLADGIAIYSCIKLTRECEGLQIETVEGLGDGHKLNALQKKFLENEAVQCGYCTPGFLMAATGLLNVNPKPSEDEVRLALSGHICSCQNFKKTIAAVTGGV